MDLSSHPFINLTEAAIHRGDHHSRVLTGAGGNFTFLHEKGRRREKKVISGDWSLDIISQHPYSVLSSMSTDTHTNTLIHTQTGHAIAC